MSLLKPESDSKLDVYVQFFWYFFVEFWILLPVTFSKKKVLRKQLLLFFRWELAEGEIIAGKVAPEQTRIFVQIKQNVSPILRLPWIAWSLPCSPSQIGKWLSSNFSRCFERGQISLLPIRGEGSERDVVYLDWPIAPSYMSPNVGGGGGGGCGVSANEYSCAHGAQINFGDLSPYLTYASHKNLKNLTPVLKKQNWHSSPG